MLRGMGSLHCWLSTPKQLLSGFPQKSDQQDDKTHLSHEACNTSTGHLLFEIQPESGNLMELLQNGWDGAILENPTNRCGIWGYCWPLRWLSDTNYCSFSEVFIDKPEQTAILIFKQTKRVWIDIIIWIKIWWDLKYLIQTSPGSNANQYKDIWFTSQTEVGSTVIEKYHLLRALFSRLGFC